jgi:hypothetical protein
MELGGDPRCGPLEEVGLAGLLAQELEVLDEALPITLVDDGLGVLLQGRLHLLVVGLREDRPGPLPLGLQSIEDAALLLGEMAGRKRCVVVVQQRLDSGEPLSRDGRQGRDEPAGWGPAPIDTK